MRLPYPTRRPAAWLLGAAILSVCTASFAAGGDAPYPFSRSATRAQSLAALSGGGQIPVNCLTPILQSLKRDPADLTTAARRALQLLREDAPLPAERRLTGADGSVLRYTTDPASFDRVDPADEDGDGIPDLVESARRGLAEARSALVNQLGLPSPGPIEIVFARLGASLDGYLVPRGGRGNRILVVLDSGCESGADGIRRSSIHQFAHAVTLAAGPAVPPDFAEAFATWAVLRVDGGPDAATSGLLSNRLAHLAAGLEADDLSLAAGNAAWFAFLDEEYGPTSVGLALDEAAEGADAATAFDRALRRSVGETLSSAFREFQLWALLVGDRSDGRHFSFADKLASPTFASVADGIPALSVQADPPIYPLGAADVLVKPVETRGGLKVTFEGEALTRWSADLLLVGTAGELRRVAIPLSSRGRGEMTVPLGRVAEVVLLVRNLEADGRVPRRYSWSANLDREFPVEIVSLEARPSGTSQGGSWISWETASERSLVGFNVLRSTEGNETSESRINPIMVPAVGDPGTPASYQFLDESARPGVSYTYRIEAVTSDGLSSVSEPVSAPELTAEN